MLLFVTLVLQGLVIYVPLNMLHGMGHRILYSIKTYGATGELIFLAFVLGPPSAALWSAYSAARSKPTGMGDAALYCLLLIPVGLLLAFSLVLAVASGIR